MGRPCCFHVTTSGKCLFFCYFACIFVYGFYKACHEQKQIDMRYEKKFLQSLNMNVVQVAETSLTTFISLYSLWSVCQYEASLTWIKKCLGIKCLVFRINPLGIFHNGVEQKWHKIPLCIPSTTEQQAKTHFMALGKQ